MTRKNIILGGIATAFFFIAIAIFINTISPNTISRNNQAVQNGSANKSPYSYIVTEAADYGANLHTDKILDAIRKIGPGANISLGDFAYNELPSENKWCDYIKTFIDTNKIKFYLVSGNHESNGIDGYIENYLKCLPQPAGTVGEEGKEYYFDFPTGKKPLARFILISPELQFSDGSTYSYVQGTKHFKWLSEAIDDARQSGIKWIIVGMHKDCVRPMRYACETKPQLVNYLIQKNVDLILQAHAHSYMRTRQLKCLLATERGVAYDESCVIKNRLSNVYKRGSGPLIVVNSSAV